MEFSGQKYRSGLPLPTLGDLPNPGIEPTSLESLALEGRFFAMSATWEAPQMERLALKGDLFDFGDKCKGED